MVEKELQIQESVMQTWMTTGSDTDPFMSTAMHRATTGINRRFVKFLLPIIKHASVMTKLAFHVCGLQIQEKVM